MCAKFLAMTRTILQRTFEHAANYLDGLDSSPVAAITSINTLRAKLGGPLPKHGIPAIQVVDALVESTSGGHLGSAGGRFFAWVIGGALDSAVAADWLTSTWDQNAALAACGPAAAVVEEVAGSWMKELLGLPATASFAFTTGCQMAHFTCLAAARHAILQARGWDVNIDGLFGAPKVRVVVSEARHASVDRALRFLGFGQNAIVAAPTDVSGRIDESTFRATFHRDDEPTIVVLDAADLNIGACDSFATLIPFAQAAGAWVHIDGAFGLMARASRAKRGHLAGVELADSWATDGHKWLNVPFDNGFACVRDSAAHRAAMTINASYIANTASSRDQIDWNPEWSRRARGFAVYSALLELGRDGVEALIDRTSAHALALVKGMVTFPGIEVLWTPTLNQGLVRFLDQQAGASLQDHDRRTDAVIAAINASGEAFFSGTSWRGMRAMRISVVNWRTTGADIERTLTAIALAAGSGGLPASP